MIPLAAGGSHAAAINSEGKLITWGNDSDGHFRVQPLEPDKGDNYQHRGINIEWKGKRYKPKMVATRGPVTAVVASSSKEMGGIQFDEIRRTLNTIHACYKEGYHSLKEMFDKLWAEINCSKDASLEEQKDKQGKFKTPIDEEQKEDSATDIKKFEIELEKLYEEKKNEKDDDNVFPIKDMQKILVKKFNLPAKEVDLFLYEMGKLSSIDSLTNISLRAIKDCLLNSRLDEGRLFIFGKTNEALNIDVDIVSKDKNGLEIKLLYNPKSYRPIDSVACGTCHLLILTTDGNLFSCGNSSQGALGLGHICENVKVPMPVKIKKHFGLRKVKMIAAGQEHSLCLTTKNEVYSWGSGVKGKLGHNSEKEERIPKEIEMLHKFGPAFISAGDSHNACITEYGRIYTWGDGQYGKLGHPGTNPEHIPTLLQGLKSKFPKMGCFTIF